MPLPSELPSIAFAMRYPDDVGLVWASLARGPGTAMRELAEVAGALVCFPVLTDRPAFQTPWATRLPCNWYDTQTPTSREQIQALVREHHIKVVFYWSCPSDSVDIRFLHGLGLRTINCEVDSYPPNSQQPLIKWLAKRLLRGWLAIGIHDRYVANAHHQRRFLLEFAALPAHRVETVVDGVDLERFTPEPRPEPAELDLPVSEYYVISVSQARPEKRVDVLVDTAIELFSLRPELSLTFVHVGGGQCLEEWKKRAAPLGDRYRFTGSKSDVVPYLRLATIFVHAAERESFGYVVAEAMACGKPIIAARIPGPSELMEEGVTGILVVPGDASGMARQILGLLDDPPRRERMGLAGRERAQRHYNSRRQAVELAAILKKELHNAR